MKEKNKKIDLCSILKSNYEDVSKNYYASDLSKIRTLAVDDTDVLVHCTSKEQADNIEKEGIIKGNQFHGVSFTNKTGGFKGHLCNAGADVCFIFSRKDIEVEPVIYDWNYVHVYGAIDLMKGRCPADGWNRPEECESGRYHAEKGCSTSMTDKEARQFEKSKRRKKGRLHQSALFIYENEFRSKSPDVKLPKKYIRIPNSCKLEIPKL